MHRFALLAVLAGCNAEHNFGDSKPSGTTAGGDGRIEIFPADGVACETISAGLSVTCGFRVNSVGEYDLRLMSMEIVNAGENDGQPVFDNLRPADDTQNFPISIDTGDSQEFILMASMAVAGTANGIIEIRTNDGSVSDPSPGKIRIPVTATATAAASNDTGSPGSDDTGEPVESGGDTGGADESGGDTGGSDASDSSSGSGDTGA